MVKDKALKVIEEVQALGELEVNSDVQAVILAECTKAGVTLERLCKTLDKGLNATRMVIDKFGEEHIEEDTAAQHKFMVTGLEMLGYLKPKSDGAVNVVIMTDSEKSELTALRGKIYDV